MASGDTLCTLIAQAGFPPAASYGTPDTRNATPVIDLGSGESYLFGTILPRNYSGGGVTAYVHYALTSATTGNTKWTVAWERVGDSQQDLDADSFATGNATGDVAVPGTSGHVDVVSITFTDGAQMDSTAVGEFFRLKVTRTAASASDATGDAELVAVELKET
jgi:hypothetical protein